MKKVKKKLLEWIWDAWCVVSIIGIWPRFIEPRLLATTYLSLPIARLPSRLVGLKILHLSDLHWSETFSQALKNKIIKRANDLKPDVILFTGDFLCCSQLENEKQLKDFLCALKASVGCFAVLGNHDYEHFVTVNEHGDYDVEHSSSSTLVKGFKRLGLSMTLSGKTTEEARQVKQHSDLIHLLHQTPFQLLNNETKQISCKGEWINICGLEEYSLGRFDPDQAFRYYQTDYPGIILSHNPDTFEKLKKYPGDVVLSGHTHGGQVNLPFLWKKFTKIEQLQFKRGLKKMGEKWGYINRGLSSVMKFRWFSLPELTLITLKKTHE